MVVRNILPSSKVVKAPQKYHYNPIPETLGEHIRKKRIQERQYQSEVARIIAVDEETIYSWEGGRHPPRVHNYPRIIAYLGYYPFNHETDSIAGKLLQVRYSNGYSRKQMALILGNDTATIRRWELLKSSVHANRHQSIMGLWEQLPQFLRK